MTRRNPFSKQQSPTPSGPVEPVDLIPTAAPKSRARSWEREHRAYAYPVPVYLVERADAIMENLLRVVADINTSDALRTLPRGLTVDTVATELVRFSLRAQQNGAQVITAEFSPERGRIALSWDMTNSAWPRELPPAPPRRRRNRHTRAEKKPRSFVTFRWDAEVHNQIRDLAGLQPGEHHTDIPLASVVLRLLEFGIGAYQAGQISPKIAYVVTARGALEGW